MSNAIVINRCYGGFGLSDEALELGRNLSDDCDWWPRSRHDTILVSVVETLGDKANDEFSELEIVYISGDTYIIKDYDGMESVVTPESIRWVKI